MRGRDEGESGAGAARSLLEAVSHLPSTRPHQDVHLLLLLLASARLPRLRVHLAANLALGPEGPDLGPVGKLWVGGSALATLDGHQAVQGSHSQGAH